MRLRSMLRRLLGDARGVTAVEYALIAGFISIVIFAGLLIASPVMSVIYVTIGQDLSSACSSFGGGSGC